MLDLESTMMRLPDAKDANAKDEKRSVSFVTVYRRKKFLGRACYFEDEDAIQISFGPSRSLAKQCYLPDTIECGIQNIPHSAEDDANTEALQFASEGVLHAEGGWPRDISYQNSEQTSRYKRKIEKTEEYISQMTNLTQTMMHMIKQNNAVNIYQNYFEEIEPLELTEQYSSRTITVFHEHNDSHRPVTNIAWNFEQNTQFAASFSDNFQFNRPAATYIWDLDAPNVPYLTLTSSHPAPCVEYNPKDSHILASGMNSGQVVVWDCRVSSNEQLVSNHEFSHRDQINCLVWFQSKTNSEFFTGSTEGQLCWWDIRKIDKPTDRIFLDPMKTTDPGKLSRAFAISAIDSDPSIATKYMAGTEQGVLFTCNRKGKTPNEKITSRVKCHYGAICSVTRSPHFIKNYMTVGDWQAKIWTEDNKDTSIVWTKEYFSQLTCGVWSETRCAVFFVGRIDGIVDVWDIVQDLNKPVYSIKISDYPVLSLKHHKEGKFIIVGTSDGHVHLQELSDNLVHTYSNERQLMASMLERETKRERFLEIRIREVKLREKELRREKELARAQYEEDKATEKDNVAVAETAFMTVIEAEIKRREGDGQRMLERENLLYNHNRTGPARI